MITQISILETQCVALVKAFRHDEQEYLLHDNDAELIAQMMRRGGRLDGQFQHFIR